MSRLLAFWLMKAGLKWPVIAAFTLLSGLAAWLACSAPEGAPANHDYRNMLAVIVLVFPALLGVVAGAIAGLLARGGQNQ